MKKHATVGFITTFSGRWPQELPHARLRQYGSWLQSNLQGELVIYEHPAGTMKQIEEACNQFRKAGCDVVIMLYGAFTGDDFPCALADNLKLPLILWAPKEPAFERDNRLYANALCSLTMNAASLKRIQRPCHALYGDAEDPRVSAELKSIITGYSLKKSMAGSLFGLFGYRPTAFYNCQFDEALIRRTFGVRIEETDLKVVFDDMDALEPAGVLAELERTGAAFDASGLPKGHAENHARLYLALKNLMTRQGYEYAAMKCWPEMGALHTTPCAVLGRLADEGVHIACEGDVDAGLTMQAMNQLTGAPVFVTDMINLDEEKNQITFWHCGNPAPSLFDTADGMMLANHPLAGQGTAFYGVLKSGAVTVARLCNLGGVYKLFLLSGRAVQSRRNTKGAMVNVEITPPVRETWQHIIKEGVPHHYCIAWGDIAAPLEQIASLWGIEVIRP